MNQKQEMNQEQTIPVETEGYYNEKNCHISGNHFCIDLCGGDFFDCAYAWQRRCESGYGCADTDQRGNADPNHGGDFNQIDHERRI